MNITKIKIKNLLESESMKQDGTSVELSGKMEQEKVLFWMQLSMH